MKRAEKPIEKITETKDQIIDVTEKKIRWKNGGGSFHAIIDGRNKIIKPGESFFAFEREIPKAFRNTIYSTDPVSAKIPIVVVKSIFEVIPSENDSALFDVVNKENGKVINGHPLEEEDAKGLASDLNK